MKLTIELVPSSCFFSNLRTELSKKEWERIRKKCYELANNKCQICGGKGTRHAVEAHEIWEFDELNKIQKLTGIISLCPQCHMVKHFGRTEIIGKREQAIKHWMKVNKFTREDFELYLQVVTEQWIKRSQIKWNLDIEFIKNY